MFFWHQQTSCWSGKLRPIDSGPSRCRGSSGWWDSQCPPRRRLRTEEAMGEEWVAGSWDVARGSVSSSKLFPGWRRKSIKDQDTVKMNRAWPTSSTRSWTTRSPTWCATGRRCSLPPGQIPQKTRTRLTRRWTRSSCQPSASFGHMAWRRKSRRRVPTFSNRWTSPTQVTLGVDKWLPPRLLIVFHGLYIFKSQLFEGKENLRPLRVSGNDVYCVPTCAPKYSFQCGQWWLL